MKTTKMGTSNYFIHVFNISNLIWIVFCARDYALVLDRMESIKGGDDDLVDFSQLKVIRKGSDYFMNGTFTYLTDMDDSYTYGVTSALSPFGNSKFIQQPFKLEQMSMCVFHNTSFRKYLEPSFKGHSNYPEIPPEGLCPIPKGTFFCKDLFIEDKNFPSHMQKGLWKVEEKYFKDTKFIGGVRFFVHVRDKK